jgi:hypothetical protein
MCGFVAHLGPGGQVVLVSDGDRTGAGDHRAGAGPAGHPAGHPDRPRRFDGDEAATDKLINP